MRRPGTQEDFIRWVIFPRTPDVYKRQVCRQLNLYWGVQPLLLPKEEDADALFNSAVAAAEEAGLVSRGDLTVLTAGVPLGVTGTTNLIKVQVAGKILVKGKGYTKKKVCGPICVAKDAEELKKNFAAGDIVVVPETTNEMLPELKSAQAVIAEHGGSNSHAAIVGLTLDIPVIVNAANATEILKSGAVVQVEDVYKRQVYGPPYWVIIAFASFGFVSLM